MYIQYLYIGIYIYIYVCVIIHIVLYLHARHARTTPASVVDTGRTNKWSRPGGTPRFLGCPPETERQPDDTADDTMRGRS